MRKKTPRAIKRERKTREILEVSLRVLIREGLDGLTVQKIAHELEWTPGALYRYYPSKDSILAAVQVINLEEMKELFSMGWAITDRAEKHRGLAALLVGGRMYADLPHVMPPRFHLVSLAVGESRQFLSGEEFEAVMRAAMLMLGELAERIERCSAAGEISPGDPIRRAVAFWSALHGAASMYKFGRFHADLFSSQNLVREQARAILVGWGASPEAVAEALVWVDQHLEGRNLLAEAEKALAAQA